LVCVVDLVSWAGCFSAEGRLLGPVMTTMPVEDLVTVDVGGGPDFAGGADSAGLSPCGAAKPITATNKNRPHRSRILSSRRKNLSLIV
jgi:hypothetical protein